MPEELFFIKNNSRRSNAEHTDMANKLFGLTYLSSTDLTEVLRRKMRNIWLKEKKEYGGIQERKKKVIKKN